MTADPRVSLLGAAAFVLGACDVPTEAPIVESRWVVAGDRTTIAVAELLPPDVEEAPDGSAFLVSVPPAGVSMTLGEMCPPCQAANGLVVPKPAFQVELTASTSLPADVESAVLSSGTLLVRAVHDFSFDPIRPGGGETGTVRFTVRSGGEDGAVLGADTVRGSATAFPPGVTVSRSVALRPAASVVSPLVLEIALFSPAGDPVRVDASDRLTVTGEATVAVSEAVVDAGGRTVTLDPVALGVEGIDDDVLDRIERGGFVLRVVNPFGVPVDVTIRVVGGDRDVTKEVTIPDAPTSTVRVDFTREELRSFLGRSGIRLTGTGVVDPAAGPATLAPGRMAVIDADIDITLRVGD